MIKKLTFKKMGINGEGIAYLDHKPVFCSGVYPGETALVDIEEDKGRYKKAVLKKITWYSRERIRDNYPYAQAEGCPLFNMQYEAQLKYKKELLAEALYKYAGVKSHFIRDMHPSKEIYGYRSQCKLPVSEADGKLVTGMYEPGTNHFVPVDYSRIHSKDVETVRTAVLKALNHAHMHAYDSKTGTGIRYLVIRSIQGISQCTLITGKDEISKEVIEEIMRIHGMSGVFQSVNTEKKTVNIFGSQVRKLAGEDTMAISVQDITLQLSPRSFYQLNVSQAEKLYEMAVQKTDKCHTLVEAYCGIGAMSLFAHKKADQVIGIESIPDAVKNAEENASFNHIHNVRFLCADAADGLYKTASQTNIDILLADPPRSGMDQKMLEAILKAKPKKIIYISCNPATLGQNLNVLKHQYHVVTVIPYDLFPNTAHVESLTVLERDNYKEGQAH